MIASHSTSRSNNSHSVDIGAVKKTFENLKADNYYTFECGAFSWNIMTDDLNLIYVLICDKEYPQRCALLFLQELLPVFRATVGQKSFTSKEGGATKTCKSLFVKMCEKYNDVSSIDVLARTQSKVDGIKLVMQQNIELSLQNAVKLEEMQDNVEDLSKKADVFKKQGGQLKNKMKWQNIKTKIILAVVVLLVLGTIAGIISYVVIKSKKQADSVN